MIELLCIQTHLPGRAFSGNTYPLVGESKTPCCNIKIVDIGTRTSGHDSLCSCGKTFASTTIVWINAAQFAQIGTEDECEQYRELVLIENQPAGAK